MKATNRVRKPYTKFKAFLIENNIKQTDLAKMLDKSKSALNQNINGTGGDFSMKDLKVIRDKLGIRIDDYFF
ncbi:helix-turn-helix domain-containing protein [Clostridium perfringens]|uniref:HTH cro/C1-type domain-containing protein n=1 Tax=Clostridium perfringens TaxID=1502 RepID=A0A133N6A2_CLOPF|nr:helix-turn-helix transcriptional regulator [Clostridium perfringens]KXA11822.1 hypothetical protein HMPREF3222_01611 [Clostridium perfringens]MDK0978071.1 helix-turn-helix transcriptional regulator [Clostridium perfringens]